MKTTQVVASASMFLFAIFTASGALAQPAHGQEEEKTDEYVEFAANIEYIKGHLEQAIANKKAGETALAVAHAGHPIGEIYSLMEEEIDEHNAELNTQLKESLTELANEIASLDPETVQFRVTDINMSLDEAKSSVIGESTRNDPKFNAMVITSVLGTAELEYEEGVSGGEIVEMIEYQDSTAFIARAEMIYESIKAQVPEHEAEEISEYFSKLNLATGSNADPEDVEASIDGILRELQEVFDLESSAQIDGHAVIGKINELLDDSVAAYKAGNTTTARALAVEAYLDNYEYIERDIEEDDPELMEKIEVAMREELVAMIDAGRPASEIEAHVTAIKLDLETARTVVVPEFPVVVALVGASIAAIVIAGRFRGTAFGRGFP